VKEAIQNTPPIPQEKLMKLDQPAPNEADYFNLDWHGDCDFFFLPGEYPKDPILPKTSFTKPRRI
jgi:hypothetical protein